MCTHPGIKPRAGRPCFGLSCVIQPSWNRGLGGDKQESTHRKSKRRVGRTGPGQRALRRGVGLCGGRVRLSSTRKEIYGGLPGRLRRRLEEQPLQGLASREKPLEDVSGPKVRPCRELRE